MRNIVDLKLCDPEDIEQLLDAAFGADRKSRTAYRLRQGLEPIGTLSFGVTENDLLVGSIQCWPVVLSKTQFRMVLVGPVAVSPSHQNTGIGRALMKAMLDAAALQDDPVMVMIGDPEYYDSFGFVSGAGDGWTLPGPWEQRRLLIRNNGRAPLPQTDMLVPDKAYAL